MRWRSTLVLREESPQVAHLPRGDIQLRHERYNVGVELLADVDELGHLALPAFGLDVAFVAVTNDVAVDGLLVIFEEFSADTAPYLVVSNEKPLFLVVAPNALSRADGHLFFPLKKVHFWPKKGVCSLPHPIPPKKVRFLIKNDLNKFLSFELY